MVMFGRLAASGRRWPVLAFAFALVLAACGGGDGKQDDASPTTQRSSPSTSSSSTSTTSTPDDSPVRAAYDAASRAFIDAAAIPDPDFPSIAATHSGPMLEQRRATLRALKRDGRAIRYPTPSQYRIDIESVELDGDIARLKVCVVDDGERVELSTGRVIASGVGTVQWTAAMQRTDGTWKLAERREEARWDGVAGCAAG